LLAGTIRPLFDVVQPIDAGVQLAGCERDRDILAVVNRAQMFKITHTILVENDTLHGQLVVIRWIPERAPMPIRSQSIYEWMYEPK
jgi:hypothetical protein